MGSRYIVTVDRDAIDKGSGSAIRVEDTWTGWVTHHSELNLGDGVVIRHGPPRQDGARVWIEVDVLGEIRRA